MNITELNAPATPPYDYQNHAASTNSKNFEGLFFDQPSRHHSESSSEHSNRSVASDASNSNTSSSETTHSAFRRVSPMSMPSPPELLIDSSEDEDNFTYSDAAMTLAASLPTSYLASSQTSPSLHSSHTMHHKRKSVPHRSPSNIVDHKSVVFQINDNCTPKILGGSDRGVLWSLRQRVSMARQSQRSDRSHNHKNRLSAPHPQRRVRPMRIQIPRPQWSRDNALYDDLVSPVNNDWQSKKSIQPIVIVPTSNLESLAPAVSVNMAAAAAAGTTTTATWQSNTKKTLFTAERKKSAAAATHGASVATAGSAATPRRKSSHHTTSGRPSRVKGPCQACNETSDGCMRKAFNWPFPTSTIFNDKGKPFVYLCNKCGLRYNKSGGCVCRNCRWVLCKEEKRKAMQLIDQMRRSRPDGRVDPDEDIENFVCTPKYWNCSRPWKVGWVLHSQHDDEDDEDTIMADQQQQSPSMSEATL
ncbi:hypothetical protein V8B55DRAFT_1459378 [Mucor lusitanicus]|uniref:Uncharacterized protein n=2 Tax=Mucor circinelloides f. lusitanicus TaxID=29924 RepID=A0A162T6W7_MUCCL|nr:hypothetical protein MUCCIDRAFT_111761 [Mucor lusitanicus CBS 277.49]